MNTEQLVQWALKTVDNEGVEHEGDVAVAVAVLDLAERTGALGVVMAYGAPPVDTAALDQGRAEARYEIAMWLRTVPAAGWLKRRTVSVATVEEVVEALASAIEHGEHTARRSDVD